MEMERYNSGKSANMKPMRKHSAACWRCSFRKTLSNSVRECCQAYSMQRAKCSSE